MPMGIVVLVTCLKEAYIKEKFTNKLLCSPVMETNKVEVFKLKVLNRLYGSADDADSSSREPERPVQIPTIAQTDQKKTEKIYTAALPVKWPPPERAVLLDGQPEVDDSTKNSSSSTESSTDEEDRCRKRRKRQRNKQNKINLTLPLECENANRNLHPEMTKNQKRKLKKRRRKEKIKQAEQTNKDSEFVYLGTKIHSNPSTGDIH